MDDDERFGLTHDKVRCLPNVNWFLGHMGEGAALRHHLPRGDARLRLAAAQVIGLVVRNIVCTHEPLYAIGGWAAPYAIGGWAAPYETSLFGLGDGDLAALNDTRSGSLVRPVPTRKNPPSSSAVAAGVGRPRSLSAIVSGPSAVSRTRLPTS